MLRKNSLKIGITFGGYAPLHRGHLDLIMRAKKENDMAFVAVCGYDGEKRTEGMGLNLITKTRLVKNFLEDDVLKVISINDTELGLDESFSQKNWNIWCEDLVTKVINYNKYNSIEKITFYVGEERYVQAIKNALTWLQCELEVVLADRTQNMVSGTECRKHQLKYWNKITQPYRDLFSHNILIAGNWIMVFMYIFWTANTVYGYIKWRKLSKTNCIILNKTSN